LGSVAVEVDENGGVISFEDYHPYGTSALRVVRSASEGSVKRYRYTGKERDEETGLYYHGARYYACWLARWTAVDPIGKEDGVNFYSYVTSRPSLLIDSTGKFGAPPVKKKSSEERLEKKYSANVKKAFDEEIKKSQSKIDKLKNKLNDLVSNATLSDWLDPDFGKKLSLIVSKLDKITKKAATKAVIRVLDVENNSFYEKKRKEVRPNVFRTTDFRCNTYATDFVGVYSFLVDENVYFPKHWWNHPSSVEKKISEDTDYADDEVFQQSPNDLNKWMHNSKQSEEFGWRKVGGRTEAQMRNEAQDLANQGFLVIFTSESHISIVVSETSKVKAGRTRRGDVFQNVVTQAGDTIERGRHFLIFDKETEGFFVYRSELNEQKEVKPILK
jgi:RHS repeat-associated protein